MTKNMKIKSDQKATNIIEYEDGRHYDPDSVRLIKQQWIEQHMTEKEESFTESSACNIFCGTWNVNAKKPDSALHSWLLPPSTPYADVYAVGFQEIVDLNAMNIAINSSATVQKVQFWHDNIKNCLESTREKYSLVMEKHLVGLLLCIFVKDSLVPHIKDMRGTSTGVGLMGVMGNKGGVAIRMSIYDSSLCFVCAHLAAHRENIAGRNADFKNIYERSIFLSDSNSTITPENSNTSLDALSKGNSLADSTTIEMPKLGATQYLADDLLISDHEIIFWIGDLNYRIDEVYSTEDVFLKIENNQIDALRTKDQLNIERAKGNVFAGFNEGVLTFPPTYKYQPGTDVYETRPEKKLRAPAWCDRVLWKCEQIGVVKLKQYRSAPLNSSDHKPVSAYFGCDLRTIVEEQRVIVFNQLAGILQKNGSMAEPKVEVKGLKIRFEKVNYMEAYEAYVEIKNIGDSTAFWHFVNKVDEVNASKIWVSMDVQSGLLLPGESTKVAVTVKVGKKTAHVLNAGKDSLDDLLILRIEQGPDYYVDIAATYSRSCYGVSLEEMVNTLVPFSTTLLPSEQAAAALDDQMKGNNQAVGKPPKPAKVICTTDELSDHSPVLGRPRAAGTEMGNLQSSNSSLSIPKELWRLIDALWTGKVLKEKDLFNSKPIEAEVALIRECLSTGTDFTGQLQAHSVVAALIELFDSLPYPVLPPEMYPTGDIESVQMRSFCRKLLEELPPLNYNVFVYFISFLREVLAEHVYNRCTPLLLANVCVSCMMLSADSADEDLSREEKTKRLAQQIYMQPVIIFLLTAHSL